MQDTGIKELFARIEVGGPPLGIEVPALVHRGHLIRARRKHLAAAGGSVAAALIAAIITLLTGNPLGSPPPVGPATRPPAPATHTPPTPPTEASCALTTPRPTSNCAQPQDR